MASSTREDDATSSMVGSTSVRVTTPVGVVDVHAIVREHGAFVWRMLRRLGVRDSDADDACQNVFIVVCRKLPEFEGRSSLRTWLYGICLREAAAYRRSARVRREVCAEAPPAGIAPDSPDAVVEERETLALLDRALEELDQDKREVFVLYEIEELPMSEVAQIVGCPVQTAYSRHRVAREHVEAYFRRASLAKGRGGT